MVLIHLRCFQFSRPTWSIQWAKPVRLRPCEAGPRIAAKADSMAASCSMSYSCLKVLADSKYQAVSSLWASFVQPSTQSEFKDTSVTEVIQIPTKQSSIFCEQGLISLTYSTRKCFCSLVALVHLHSCHLPCPKRMAKPVWEDPSGLKIIAVDLKPILGLRGIPWSPDDPQCSEAYDKEF